jgi:hypothetical protein
MMAKQYEAVGKLIYGFQRHHGLVDRMLVLMGVSAAPDTELADKLVALEARLGQFDDMPDARAAITAFVAQMRSTRKLIERATAPQPPAACAYVQQWSGLDSAAESAWARMMEATQARRRTQAPPA